MMTRCLKKVETFNGVKSSNGAKNILILGSDTRGEDAGRADTIMVLQLNGPSKTEINFIYA